MGILKFCKKAITESTGKGALDTNERKIRFLFRTFVFYPFSIKIINFVSNHKYLSVKFTDYMVIISKIYRPYLCSFFNLSKRISSIKESYQFVDKYFPQYILSKLYMNGEITLGEIIGIDEQKYKISLSFYPTFDKEGEIQVKLTNFKDMILSILTFSFIKYNTKDTLFIGGIQAGKNVQREVIKDCTKSLSGIFPKRILIEVLYDICKYLKINTSKICVGNDTHVFATKNYKRRKTIFSDYDQFIESLNSKKLQNGLWQLPDDLHRKKSSEIPSKKRGEYRRKYQIFEQIEKIVKDKFN